MKVFMQFAKTHPFLLTLVLLAFGTSTIALNPTWRDWIRGQILSKSKTVLATATIAGGNNSPTFKIVKTKSFAGQFVEVYVLEEDEQFKMLQNFALPDLNDGYFLIGGQSTNLAIQDVNKDGLSDIVVPSFDQQQNPRLNIFVFNGVTGYFEKMSEN